MGKKQPFLATRGSEAGIGPPLFLADAYAANGSLWRFQGDAETLPGEGEGCYYQLRRKASNLTFFFRLSLSGPSWRATRRRARGARDEGTILRICYAHL